MVYAVELADGFEVSDDPDRLDRDAVYQFISAESYWGRGRPRDLFDRGIRNRICFGLYAPDGQQIGFASVMSDLAMRAHLGDVYVLPAYRGRGLGQALVGAVLSHPDLTAIGTWTLNTDDAHGLYAAFGFGPLARPETFMIRLTPGPGTKTS
jgi:GNAT superfamily N-acetyltransferase